MAQGQDTIDRDWAEIEAAQKAALDADWAEIEAAQKPRAKPTYVPGRSRRPADPPGAIESAAAGFLGGMSGAVESGIGMVSELYRKGREFTGAPNIPGLTSPLTDLRGSIAPGSGRAGLEQRPKTADTFWGKVFEDLPENAGSTFGSLLFAAAGGPVAGAAGLGAMGTAALTGAGSGALVNAGQSYYETLAKTGDEGTAWESAGWNALIGTTEAADTLILGGLGKGATKGAKAALLKSIRQKLGSAMKEVATGMGTEATQEAVQTGLSALVDSKLTGEEKDYWNEIRHAAATGALMGGALGGASALRGDGAAPDEVIAPGQPGYVPPEPSPVEQQEARAKVGVERPQEAVEAGPEVESAPAGPENGARQVEPERVVDPLERVVQDMTLTQSRIRNLEGQAKHAKGKGQTDKGFKIDKELLGLKEKLRGLAIEFQDEAAARRGPEEEKAVEAAPIKQPWEMSLEEVSAAETEAKGGDQALLVKLFGEEGAKRYAKADKMRDSKDPKRSDEGQRIADEMESTLSKAQQDKLFGIGDESLTPDELAEYRQKLQDVDVESPEEMGKSLRWALSELGGAKETDPAKMTRQEQLRYAQVKHAMGIAAQEGWDPQVVLKSGIQAAADRFSDPQDALFMLRRFFPGLEQDDAGRMVPRNPLTDPIILRELQGMAHESGQSDVGGQITKDPETGERSRTYWTPKAEWWNERPGNMTASEVQNLIEKVTKDPNARLGGRQQEMLDWMVDRAEREYGTGPYEQDRRAAERARAAAAGEPAPTIEEFEDTSFEPGSWEAEVADAIVLKGETPPVAEHYVRSVQAVSSEIGKPPGTPPPPPPTEMLPTPSENTNGLDDIRQWIGERQLGDADAERRGGLWKQAIDATLPRSIGRFLKERFAARANRARYRIEMAANVEIDTRGKLDDEFSKYGQKLSDEKKQRLIDAANLTPEQRAVVDSVTDYNTENGKRAFDERIISRYYEEWTQRLWKGLGRNVATDKVLSGPSKFQTFTVGRLPRTRSSMLEGWAMGDELQFDSFIDSAVNNAKTLNRIEKNLKLIETGKKGGWLRFPAPSGWVQIKHPNFTDEIIRARISAPDSAETLKAALSRELDEDIPLDEAVKIYGSSRLGQASMVVGRDMKIVPRGDEILVFQKVPLSAPPAEARLINNALGRSALSDYIDEGTPGAKVAGFLDKLGTITKTLWTAGVNDNIVWLAMSHFYAQPGSSLKATVDTLTLAPYRRGQKMIRLWEPDHRGLVKHGLLLNPGADMQRFFELQKGRLITKLEEMKIVGPPARFITNTYVDLQNFLYGKFIPALKLNLASLELMRLRKSLRADLMSGKTTDEKLMQAAAQLANNIFGGQNWQMQGMNPTAMHAIQHAFLAPDRMASNLRVAADAVRSGALGAAHRALWGRMTSRYVFLWLASNLATAAMADEEDFSERQLQSLRLGLREFLGVDVGPLLERVGRDNPARLFIQLSAQKFEMADLVTDPIGYLRNKAGVLASLGIDAYTGENYVGKAYTTISELFGKDDKGLYKTTQLGHHYRGEEKGGRLAGQTNSHSSGAAPGHLRPAQYPSFVLGNLPLPFEVQAWLEAFQGQTDAFDAALQTLGFRTMSPSAKRQEEAGIGTKPAINFEELYPR